MSLASHPLVKQLGEKFLPEFREIADRINQTIPNVSAEIESHEVGSLTQYQGYSFWIVCCLTDAADDQPEDVGLEISLGHLTTNPKIYAGVGWGYPSGSNEASFSNGSGIFPDEGLVVSDKVLEDLSKELPRLYEVLFQALKRRKPSDE